MTFSILDIICKEINLKKIMHELTLTQTLLNSALQSAHSRRIRNVTFLIGPFSEEREESIRYYWRDLAKGTLGEGAEVSFEHVEAEAKCLACGATLNLDDNQSICRYCQSESLQLLGSNEVRLERVVVE